MRNLLQVSVLWTVLVALACAGSRPSPSPGEQIRPFTGAAETSAAPASGASSRLPSAVVADSPNVQEELSEEEASGLWSSDLEAEDDAAAPLVEAPPRTRPQPFSSGLLIPSPASVEGWRIHIPELGVDAPVVPVGLEPDGTLGAPEGPDVVGWYRYGPVPGQRGNVLLDGHVDWTNRQTGIPFGAVFWKLARLSPGSQITITDGTQHYVYTVSEKLRFRWDDPAGASVLQPTSDARITLITCGGTFDRATRNYSMRDVVIAHLVG